MMDYGKAAWLKLQRMKFKREATKAEAIIQFDVVWTKRHYLCKRIENQVQWSRFNFDHRGLIVA
jgi:hypothetical protein